MNAHLNTRLSGLALAVVMTMAMLLTVDTLATSNTQAPQMAQHSASAPQT
jgi:hypothetical protein